MIVQIPLSVLEILKNFKEKKFEIYIVGGAVRDLLMSRVLYDWDFTTNATPEQILKLFPDAFYDNQFGTVGVPNQTDRPFEITTFRTEHGYSDSRRPDKVIWGKNLQDDLMRRDFTINAMAISPAKDVFNKKNKKTINEIEVEIIDPYDGLKDLEKKRIRAVGDPERRFNEDALRMMRAIRIATELDFVIEKKTSVAIEKNIDLIDKISSERIRDETLKILSSSHPYEGFILLKETGLLYKIIPEFEEAFQVEQKSPKRHHKYDVGTHSFLSLKFCPSTNPIVRLATLIHDLGKVKTYKKQDDGIITFYNHEIVSAKIAKNTAKRLRLSKAQSDKLYRLVRYHQFTVNENQTDAAIRRFIKKVGKENVSDMLDLRTGDRLGGGATETSWRLEEFKKRLIEVQKQPFTVHDLKISGDDVMKKLKIKPGPKVGEVLNILFEEVVDKKIQNNKRELLKRISGIKL